MASIYCTCLCYFNSFSLSPLVHHFLHSISFLHVHLSRHSSCFPNVLARVFISFVTPNESSYIHFSYTHLVSQLSSRLPVFWTLQQVMFHCFLSLPTVAHRTIYLSHSM